MVFLSTLYSFCFYRVKVAFILLLIDASLKSSHTMVDFTYLIAAFTAIFYFLKEVLLLFTDLLWACIYYGLHKAIIWLGPLPRRGPITYREMEARVRRMNARDAFALHENEADGVEMLGLRMIDELFGGINTHNARIGGVANTTPASTVPISDTAATTATASFPSQLATSAIVTPNTNPSMTASLREPVLQQTATNSSARRGGSEGSVPLAIRVSYRAPDRPRMPAVLQRICVRRLYRTPDSRCMPASIQLHSSPPLPLCTEEDEEAALPKARLPPHLGDHYSRVQLPEDFTPPFIWSGDGWVRNGGRAEAVSAGAVGEAEVVVYQKGRGEEQTSFPDIANFLEPANYSEELEPTTAPETGSRDQSGVGEGQRAGYGSEAGGTVERYSGANYSRGYYEENITSYDGQECGLAGRGGKGRRGGGGASGSGAGGGGNGGGSG